MKTLIVTAVAAEASAIGPCTDTTIVVSGIGRTNAAAMTTETIIKHGPFDMVFSAGVAGSLPASGLNMSDSIVASSCVYAEEGLMGPSGFTGMEGLGFQLGDFRGNSVPVDPALLEQLGVIMPIGPIATVATCSGTDAAAAEVARRTGALAEAMEGAAVVHAARRLQTPAIEIRTISNTTGDREHQQWDLPGALLELGRAVESALAALGVERR